jgi:peptidylprolyl isomerase
MNLNTANLVSTPSGLQYEEQKVGEGASPTKGKQVTVHYTGWLTDGTKFDSSVDRGSPFQFALGVGQVIKGWDEGVSSMKVGGKRRLVIPSDLAYGTRGVPGVIPGGATLVFDVELLGV